MTPKTRRRLFLDDDPARADVFLAEHPDAVWVQTAADCIARLAEPWDEVYLDHDLGGEHFVDSDRVDCGMEVVRWLDKEPRHHLRKARFTVHSHNMPAAFMMAMQIGAMGFRVDALPFGQEPPEVEPPPPPDSFRRRIGLRALALLRRLGGTRPIPTNPHGPKPADVEPPGYLP